jgi:hypothetical protein
VWRKFFKFIFYTLHEYCSVFIERKFYNAPKKHKSKEPDISRDDIFKEVGVLKVENEFLKKSTDNCTAKTLPYRKRKSGFVNKQTV